MTKDLPGFEKSAPVSTPATRSQKPVSAWDIDLSPFHRLAEQQIVANRQLIDTFLDKVQQMLENRGGWEEKTHSILEKLLLNQKKQSRDNIELHKNFSAISEEFIELRQLLPEMLEKNSQILDSIQKNTHELIRPAIAQENLLREGFAPAQILTPLERLLALQQETLSQLEAFVTVAHRINDNLDNSHNHLSSQVDSIGQRLSAMEKSLLTALPSNNVLQQNQEKSIARLVHYCERMMHSMENFSSVSENIQTIYTNSHELLKRQQTSLEQQEIARRKENLIFWLFVAIALLLFIWLLFKTP